MPTTSRAADAAEADLRLLANRAKLFALLAVIVVAASLLAALDMLPLIDPFARALAGWDWALLGTTLLAFLHRLAPLIPPALYLLAVLGAAGILDHVSAGEYFSERNVRALGDMGGAMLWGAVWAAFLVPSIGDWTAGLGGYRVDFRPETLVIGTIGLCLLVLGRLFVRVQRLEAEMEAIV